MDSTSSAAPNQKRLNILTLDGGGVRGLSSLLILRDLMTQINLSIRKLQPSNDRPNVGVHEIFKLVAGTSTGGLVALMLGKVGLTPDQCIKEYRRLSCAIFGRRHFRARFTGGFAPSKYSGSNLEQCVRELLGRNHLEGLQMLANDRDLIACSVVCREHQNESRYSEFKPDAVCICSLPCPNTLECLVCEAARATTAAPTYFPLQKIGGRAFVDGGLKFNNPSFAIFDHYSQVIRVAESQRASMDTNAGISISDHGSLDFSMIRIVNLGTGTKPDTSQSVPGFVTNLVPPPIRMLAFLQKTLKEIAVDSENVAAMMKSIARVSGNGINVKFDRFSANNGVCYIKMDNFKELETIESLTREYLETERVQDDLRRVAEEIAREFIEDHPTHTGRTMLMVPDSRSSRPRGTSPSNANAQPRSTFSEDHHEGSASTGKVDGKGPPPPQTASSRETQSSLSLKKEITRSTGRTQSSTVFSEDHCGSSAGTSISREAPTEPIETVKRP